jgi:Uncharacterised nucleotidyltransferase
MNWVSLLVESVAKPASVPALVPAQWATLLSISRRAGLSIRLAHRLQDGPGLAEVPAGPRLHLESALLTGASIARDMRTEVMRLQQALAAAQVRCVLLKGAAYLSADLPAARGRVFGDIDILVPQAEIGVVEAALMAAGWISHDNDAYNQRYYRQWMHELPPLTHVHRGSTIDVHHTITPPTSRFRVDGAALLAAAQQAAPGSALWVLQPVDMVLHSAVHLFAEGEFDRGLRDLLDLHDLLIFFGAELPDFWPHLFGRARALGLQRPLHHALAQLSRWLGYSPPDACREKVDALRPAWLPRVLMGWLLGVALRPVHPVCHARGEGLARWLLYVRSHWLRMPLHLLAVHLMRKAWRRQFPARTVKPRDATQGA